MNVTAPSFNASPQTAGNNPSAILFGRYMLPDMSEHPCQVAQLTAESAIFLTSVEVPAGVAVVAYIDEIGRIEGTVSAPVQGGFGVAFRLTGSRRERIQARLDWLRDKDGAADEGARRHTRYEPKDNKSHITLPDGRVYPCEVIDISLSGAAVTTEVMPSLGTYVLLGKMRGRVVRFHESGIALEFVKPLDQNQLANQVG